MGKHEDKRANIFLATVAMLSAFFVYSSMVLTGKRFQKRVLAGKIFSQMKVTP